MSTSFSARWRGLRTKAGHAVATSSYLRKWALLGALIGVIAGLGAVAFFEALKLATRLFLHVMAGFSVPNPVAEGGGIGSAGFTRPWALPLVVALGGCYRGSSSTASLPRPRDMEPMPLSMRCMRIPVASGSGSSSSNWWPRPSPSVRADQADARVPQPRSAPASGPFWPGICNLSPADGRIAVSTGIGSGIGGHL